MPKLLQSKLIADLKTLANGKSKYSNSYPDNLLYWNGERFTADCVNLYKALFNGRDITDRRTGSYQRSLTVTSDCSEWGLLKQCSDLSQNFSKLKPGEFRCLYMDGHFGGYLGEEFIDPATGGLVNVVEASPAWLDGIQFSYVDAYGGRYWYKGGERRGTWTWHGVPSKFVTIDSPEADITDFSVAEWQKAAQADGLYLGDIDGMFGPLSLKAACVGVIYGCPYKNLIIFWQKWMTSKGFFKGNIDGAFGPVTKAAVVKAQEAYGIGTDGAIGPVSTKAFLGI